MWIFSQTTNVGFPDSIPECIIHWFTHFYPLSTFIIKHDSDVIEPFHFHNRGCIKGHISLLRCRFITFILMFSLQVHQEVADMVTDIDDHSHVNTPVVSRQRYGHSWFLLWPHVSRVCIYLYQSIILPLEQLTSTGFWSQHLLQV